MLHPAMQEFVAAGDEAAGQYAQASDDEEGAAGEPGGLMRRGGCGEACYIHECIAGQQAGDGGAVLAQLGGPSILGRGADRRRQRALLAALDAPKARWCLEKAAAALLDPAPSLLVQDLKVQRRPRARPAPPRQ